MSELDEQELLATRILNKKANWREVQEFIDKNYIDKSNMEWYLKRRIKSVDKCYENLVKPFRTEYGINVSSMTRKEKEKFINKRNCLLVQRHCYNEILEKFTRKGKTKE